MSDPVANVGDVEDVLSSIRRLVSETSSDARADGPADDEAEATPAEGESEMLTDDTTQVEPEAQAQDALILTSALRIKEPEPPVPANTVSELDSLRKAVSGAFGDADETDDAPEVAEDDAAEATAGDVTKLDLPESRLHLASFKDIENAADEEQQPTSWSGKPPEDYYEDEVEEDASIAAAADDDETWVFKKPDIAPEEVEAEEDTLDAATDEVEDEITEEENGEVDSAEIHQFAAPEDATAEEAVDQWHEGEAEAEDVAVDVAAEEDVAEHAGDEANDTPQMATFVRAAPDVSEVEAAEIAEAVNTEEEPATMFDSDEEDDLSDDGPTIDLSELDEGVIDEDMLRDMVADIVRQELTGAMGERITRNVRKLVRREIHRAMVAREFD